MDVRCNLMFVQQDSELHEQLKPLAHLTGEERERGGAGVFAKNFVNWMEMKMATVTLQHVFTTHTNDSSRVFRLGNPTWMIFSTTNLKNELTYYYISSCLCCDLNRKKHPFATVFLFIIFYIKC